MVKNLMTIARFISRFARKLASLLRLTSVGSSPPVRRYEWATTAVCLIASSFYEKLGGSNKFLFRTYALIESLYSSKCYDTNFIKSCLVLFIHYRIIHKMLCEAGSRKS